MKRILFLLATAFPFAAACSSEDSSNSGGTTEAAIPVEGEPVLLGMNPAPPFNMTYDQSHAGWPAAGSSTSLYMARIWDMDVTWAHIEPDAPVNGVHDYHWDRLDKFMTDAVAADMRPMYVFYGTPHWATNNCLEHPKIHACVGYPDKYPEEWSAFTRAVATRYVDKRTPTKGEAPVYEVWNEPNLKPKPNAEHWYWNGTDEQLLDLNRRAFESVKSVAPGAFGTILCCGWNRLAANDDTSPVDRWLKLGGKAYVDVISYHPYPDSWDPGTAADYTGRFRAAMARHGADKPLWATEVGFLGDGVRAFDKAQQAAIVSQTILTLRAKSVPVILWYTWDESFEGEAKTSLLGLHRVVAEAVKAAGSDPNVPPASECDPDTQPKPLWDVKNGKCLGACGVIGGTKASLTPCVKQGLEDVGEAYDVAYCCKEPSKGSCDPQKQPPPQWGEKNGQCLAGCGVIGGTSAFTTPCDQNGKVDAGMAYDVAYCCWDGAAPTPICDPVTQPSPQWGYKNGQCLPSCGGLGGTSAFETPCAQNGKVDAGSAYDVAYCCKDGASSVCDPATQPSPQWGVKDGKCLQACGLIGGTSAFETPCAQNGKVDVGQAYDVAYCCKDPSSICDPATQPSPQWGVKNGQCLPACGVAGGTCAFTTPCAQNNKADAGAAYDVDYCCKELCDPGSQPSPQWGAKNGKCLQACGLIGGTAAFESPCSTHGMTDAGEAYDVAYCCK
jgi:hypothetical protein